MTNLADGCHDPAMLWQFIALAAAIEAKSEHPLARAIVDYTAEIGASVPEAASFKQMAGRGLFATVEGRTCLAGNRRLMEESGVDVAAFDEQAQALADEGKTVLYFASEGQLAGAIAVADTVKPSSAAAIAALRSAGLTCVMLTGDNERTAAAIQRQVGLDRVVAGVLPEGKEAVIRELQESGPVAMVGDGINDAPALARADVGIAIGAGTDVAIESANVVLTSSDLADVPAALDLSHATMRNIKQNLFWALFYNAICIPVAAGVLVGVAGFALNPMIAAACMSCSSVCVVTNALRLRGWKPKAAVAGGAAQVEQASEVQVSAIEVRQTGQANEPAPADNPAEKENEVETTLKVEGMMCQHCVAHVKKALEGIEGVASADVDLDAGRATAHLTAEVPAETLIAAVVDAGYEAEVA